MISGMDAPTDRPPAARHAMSASRWSPAALAGIAGCLFLVVATSPPISASTEPYPPPFAYRGDSGPSNLQDWLFLLAPAVATAVGLFLLRWWPYLLVAAALIDLPAIAVDWNLTKYSWVLDLLPRAGYFLALIALLACAQGLIRTAAGWSSAVAALTLGSRLLGPAIANSYGWQLSPDTVASWHSALLALGLAGIAPAVWRYRRGDERAARPASDRSWPRTRLIAVGTLAASVSIPLSFLTTQHLADLLGVTWSALARHEYAQTAAIGAITLVTVTLLAALAGRWSLAGALIAAVAEVAVISPAALAAGALSNNDPLRWLAAIAGVTLGAAVAGNRWRFQLAATLTVFAAMALFIAVAATTGHPEKLAEQRVLIPSVLILVLCAATASAVVGATAPVLAPRGALPFVLGPIAGTLALGGLQTIQVTDQTNGTSPFSTFDRQFHLTTSAALLLVAGAAIAGLGFAHQLATRRAERKQAEQIRREAAAAERDRLARPIHDGVLQVLALVQRHGSELGGQGSELAELAGEQEAALRSLLSGRADAGRGRTADLRAALRALAAPAVEVVTPAQPVWLRADTATEVVAAVRAAMDNVRQHAGPDARAWILLEDERDAVRVTVRDDGIGFPPHRLAEAAEAGRLGIAQSMRGRIADHGGTTTIHSQPGEGTEVEFWVPRDPPADQ